MPITIYFISMKMYNLYKYTFLHIYKYICIFEQTINFIYFLKFKNKMSENNVVLRIIVYTIYCTHYRRGIHTYITV